MSRFLPLLAGLIVPFLLLLASALPAQDVAAARADWTSLIQRVEADPAEASAGAAQARVIARTLMDALRAEAVDGSPQRAEELANFLTSEQSLAMVEALIPNGVEALRAHVQESRGFARFNAAQRSALRGEQERARQEFIEAAEIFGAGTIGWARAFQRVAGMERDRGLELFNRGQTVEAETLLRQSIAMYEFVGREVDDPGVRRESVENIRLIASRIPAIAAERAVPVAVEVPPAPEPGLLDAILGEGGHARAMEWLASFGESPVWETVLLWGGIAVAFSVIYWVFPGLVLKRLSRGGDLLAAQARPKVRFFGIFALVSYAMTRIANRQGAVKAAKEHACPHCGYALDDPDSYQDLVFSKCPKCREQVTPLFTLEGYISHLASGLSAELEATANSAPLERFVKKDGMTRLIRAVITLAVRRRASDLHFEPDETGLSVRQRIDGMITEMIRLPRSLALPIVSAIKVAASLDISERRKPQDGKLSMMIDKTDIDIRVATSPSGSGEKASLRLLDVRSIQMDAGHLGMNVRDQAIFHQTISQPHGLILVGGPTGSGKTTTLYVALQSLKTSSKNIISIEDPIEFRIPGVNQIQVNPVAELTFASGLRSILRQDPDVIMVGEIRDKETAEISVSAASTGHLVFSTLHAIDAASSIARLMDLGVTPRQFADALSLVLSQRLVRLICRYCAEDVEPDFDILAQHGVNRGNVQGHFRKGRGCAVCNNTGYYRRTGIFEFLQPSQELRSAIEGSRLSTGEIRELATKAGMRTLRQEVVDLYCQGLTTAEETLRVTK